MKRREFIALIGCAAAGSPLAVRAQQSGKVVGVLQAQEPTSPPIHIYQSFLSRLREHGWIEGQNLRVEFRGAPTIDRMTELAGDLVGMKVDVIFASASPQVEAARRVTKTIPIVFATHGDPVGAGHVVSLAQPGGNITGLSDLAVELAFKVIQVLKDAIPNAKQIGALWNTDNPLPRASGIKSIEATASKIGLLVHVFPVRSEDDFEAAFSSMKQVGIASFIGIPSAFIWNRRVRLAEVALKYGLAGAFESRENVEAGGLMSYGPSFEDLFRRAADYVDKILRAPAQPTCLSNRRPNTSW